jgi:DNA invertase Pin-like site-specific DNA recombinase
LTTTYIDNDTSASGKVHRPEFEKMMDALGRGEIDVIIAWSLDRLTRNRQDTVRLIESCQKHRTIIALARGSDLDMSTAMGRMMADQLAGWARYEIEQKSDRQIRANAQKARAGKPHGSRRPFGYEADMVTINETEAAIMREMARRYLAGHSFKEIAIWANEQGHATSMGRPWHNITVRNLLNRKRNAGLREYDGVDYPAVWDPVFDPATWEQLQLTIRLRREQSNFKGPIARKYLLTGLAYCGRCGNPLSGTRMYDLGPSFPPRRVYFCAKRTDAQGKKFGCNRIRRNAEALDDWIKECVLYRLDTPELGNLLKRDNDTDVAISLLLHSRQAAKTRLDALVEDYATGLLDREQFSRAKGAAEAELERLERELEVVNRHRTAAGLIPVGDSVRAAWDNSGSDTWRRTLLAMLIDKIVVNPGSTKPFYVTRDGQRHRFDPQWIDIQWKV